ncbi:MAG: hypothetical protein KJO07_17255 [Deltaproteobacteria bacterium]|nr:hypothetical protein [Deltaproteobacteria bacterium]
MVVRRLALLGAIALGIGCEGPPESVDQEPLVFALQYDDLPALSDLCSPRGRLFAVGRRQGGAVFMEERSSGMTEVDLSLEVDAPVVPLVACWQVDRGEVYAVGGSQVLVRTLEGEYSLAELGTEGAVELYDVAASAELGPVVVGSVDGAGAMFTLADEGGWQQLELGSEPVPPLIRVAISGTQAYAVGQQGELIRWRDGRAERLFSVNQRLTGIVVSEQDALAFALDGAVLRIDGNDVVPFAQLEARWLDGGFTADGNLWLAGRAGVVTRHRRKPSMELASVPRQADFPEQTDLIAIEAGRDRLLVLAAESQSAQIWQLAPAE